MRRASVLVAALVLMGTAQAADWHTIHDRAIHRHHLEQNWGKDEGAQSPGSLFYQEYRTEVVEEARERFVETVPAPVVSSSEPSSEPVVVTGSIQKMICSYDWECSIALGVAGCESGFNPYADNPNSSAHGVFQKLGETSNDPATQIANAYVMWVSSYWKPWGWPDGSFGCYF